MPNLPDTAEIKIEDAVQALLQADAELSEWDITTDVNRAIEQEADKTLLISTPGFSMDQSSCQGQTDHRMVLELAFMSGPQPLGVVSRANKRAAARAHSTVVADRYLGGMLQDLQERDAQPVGDELKDLHAYTIQYDVEFYTPRDDWTTIVGQGGETF